MPYIISRRDEEIWTSVQLLRGIVESLVKEPELMLELSDKGREWPMVWSHLLITKPYSNIGR